MTTPSVSSAKPRRRYQEELVPAADRKSEKSDDLRQGRVKKQRDEYNPDDHKVYRKSKKKDSSDAPPPAPPSAPPPVSAQPVGPATPVADPAPSQSLAEKYVSQYEAQSGHTLSAEEHTEKVKQVEDFYGESSRKGRLEKIVFA